MKTQSNQLSSSSSLEDEDEDEDEELAFASTIRLPSGSRVVEPPFPLKVLDFSDCNPPMRLFSRQASCFLRSSSSLMFTKPDRFFQGVP